MGILKDVLPTVTVNPHIDSGGAGAASGAGSGFSSGIQTGATGGAANPQLFIYNASVILLWVLGLAAVGTLIYAGFKYVTAGGDADKAESAKKIITGSIIGLFIIIFSYLIFNTAIDTISSTSDISNPDGSQIKQIYEKNYQPNP